VSGREPRRDRRIEADDERVGAAHAVVALRSGARA
jgi:hypothetical protein